MGWRWFGCVCHRFQPGKQCLSLGRRRNFPNQPFRESDIDLCLKGLVWCDSWPGKWPIKCQIGIIGWLMSCRNAYVYLLPVWIPDDLESGN
ncbi:hypothetical protein EDB81DRAFT_810918 [Dactylonectria macrodidyma]|uniref:Uncharacterized protein n=1 Tax=Dactylonectria macrodidyma TaxID=307937 RepID=A0A9P9DSM5_9HYPO|nr:hypothetical protein EDB81DRAFT_810918 [Dactylonectria macrodidyma]